MTNERLALRLLEYHGGGGTYVYAVGSHLFAGHTPDSKSVVGAIGELLSLEANHPECITKANVVECGKLAKHLVAWLTQRNLSLVEVV